MFLSFFEKPNSLARSLYNEVDIDKPIPEALFEAVAEVLAYVYKMSKGKR